MSNTNFYKRISGSSIQGNAYTVIEPNGTIVVANGGELRLHDGSTAGGNEIVGGGGGFATTSSLVNGNYSVSLSSSTGVLTLSTASTILGSGTDPNVYIETFNGTATNVWTFGTNGILTLPTATPKIQGSGTGTDVTIVASTGTNDSTWVFAADGSIILPTDGIIKVSDNTGGTGGYIKFYGAGGEGDISTGDNNTSPTSGDIDIVAGVDGGYENDHIYGGLDIGNIRLKTKAYTGQPEKVWKFGWDGTLTVPGPVTAVDGLSAVLYASSGTAAIVSNYSGFNQLFVQDDGVYVQTSANNSGTTFTNWTFGTDGTLTVPGNINSNDSHALNIKTRANGFIAQRIDLSNDGYLAIQNYAEPVTGTTFTGADWDTATWDGTQVNIINASGLLAYLNGLTGVKSFRINGEHLLAGLGYASAGDNVFLSGMPVSGSLTTVTEIIVYQQQSAVVGLDGTDNSVQISAETKQWKFAADGTIHFPDSVILAPTSQSITMQSDQYSQLMWMNADQTTGTNKMTNSDFYVESGNATLDIGYLDGAGVQKYTTWLWNADGALTLPTNGYIVPKVTRYTSTASGTTVDAPAIDVNSTKVFLSPLPSGQASYTLGDGVYDGQTIEFYPEWASGCVMADVQNIFVYLSKIFDINTPASQYLSGGQYAWYLFQSVGIYPHGGSKATATWNAQQQNWVIDPYWGYFD
jgi:hypothetical protein